MIADEIFSSIAEQCRVSEERLKRQAEDLCRVRLLHEELVQVLRTTGLDNHVPLVERASEIVSLAAAEVEHAAEAWRRAIHRAMTDTQPIDLSPSR